MDEKMKEITIKIDKNTADMILRLNGRYYFGLFENIALDLDEEYQFRDAISELSKKINESSEGKNDRS